MRAHMRGGCLLAAWLVLSSWAVAASGPVAEAEAVSGIPQVAEPVEDPDFGVRADALGLRREVQMWQWQRDGEGFNGTWSAEPIDASDFPSDHANPGEPSYGSARWFAGQARLGGRRLAPELLASLSGWEPLPATQAAAALPPNLAAVFQPDGEWLSSSADPGQPHIGDLRIRWQRLPNGPVHGELVAEGQRWVAAGPGAGLARGEPRASSADDPLPGLPGRDAPGAGLGWLAWALLAFMLVGGFVLYRRNR